MLGMNGGHIHSGLWTSPVCGLQNPLVKLTFRQCERVTSELEDKGCGLKS